MARRRVLITDCARLIGRHIVDALLPSGSAPVCSMTSVAAEGKTCRKRPPVYQVDMRDKDRLTLSCPTRIYPGFASRLPKFRLANPFANHLEQSVTVSVG